MQVEQFDIHTPALTIRESFSFSASLRLMDVSMEQREEFVDEVRSESMLASCLSRCTAFHVLSTNCLCFSVKFSLIEISSFFDPSADRLVPKIFGAKMLSQESCTSTVAN